MVKKNTTMDRLLREPKRKKRFEKSYEKFLLSEALRYVMDEHVISVRELAKKSKISTTQIQGIRSGDKVNVTMSTLDSIFEALGFKVSILLSDGERELLIS